MDKNRSKAEKTLPVEGRENMAETDTVTCEDGCLQDASGGRDFLFTLFHHSFGDSRGLKRNLACIPALCICRKSGAPSFSRNPSLPEHNHRVKRLVLEGGQCLGKQARRVLAVKELVLKLREWA